RVSPGNANAIPGRVSAWLDARGASEGAVRALVEELSAGTAADGEGARIVADGGGARIVADGERVRLSVREESWTPEVAFDTALRDRLARVAGGDTPAPILPTGAGHDAGILATAGIPSAMLFVRNPTGVSHSPEEHADQADCHAGVVALADVLEDLCR
ncbi:MAG: M20/M25/M40 family metallo-hydrolase, partial [Nonomuraea sp.]|nr:M20/M25/M40 family metallo-hydrolase [Nonomuraea sp.]